MKLKTLFAAALLASTSLSQAANLSFTGNFTYDNDVQRFSFVVGDTSTVTLRSWSYAGGVNAAGETIARGGFDPILALFAADGTRLFEQDDATCGFVAADAVTNQCYDVNYQTLLSAGTYYVTVQQYHNRSRVALSEGFFFEGEQYRNFRNGFVDYVGDKRDAHWAFDILNVNSAEQEPPSDVPEPMSLALLAAGTAGLAATRRRRTRRA